MIKDVNKAIFFILCWFSIESSGIGNNRIDPNIGINNNKDNINNK